MVTPIVPQRGQGKKYPAVKGRWGRTDCVHNGIILIAICPAKNRCYVKKFTYDVSFFTYDVSFFT